MSTAKLNGNINGKREDDYLQKIIQEIAAKHKVPFKPKKIVAQGNAIAIVDRKY